MRLLLVIWHDVETKHTGWADLSEIKTYRPPVAKSVGWELDRDQERLILVSAVIGEEGSCDQLIPLGTIISEVELPQ